MTKNRTPTPVYLDPGMHSGLEVKGLNILIISVRGPPLSGKSITIYASGTVILCGPGSIGRYTRQTQNICITFAQ